MQKACLYVLLTISALALILPILWIAGLWYYQPICLIPSGMLLLGMFFWKRQRRSISVHFILWALVIINIITYHLLPPPQPAQWEKPWAVAPEFEQDGHLLTIHNLRDFRYRTEQDSTARYLTETYDLATLTGVDFAECHWDGMEAVCHTMLSFHFADGKRFVVSAETRLPEGMEQNAIAGLYKQYGLLYLFGTEEDIFGLRTNIRHEDLSVYPMNISPESGRKLLQHFIQLAQEAAAGGTPYNTISANCSTGLVSAFRSLAPNMPRQYDFLPLHNGSIAGILIRSGAVQHLPGESEDDIRRRCYVGYDIPLETYSSTLHNKIKPKESSSRQRM